MSDSDTMVKQLGLRVADSDLARLDALAARLGQGKHATARAALRLGMHELECAPGAFVSQNAQLKPAAPPTTRPKKAKR